MLMVRFFLNCSVEQDTSGDPGVTRLFIVWSYSAIVVFVLTMSFAAFDWIMTHDPYFYSMILGVYYFVGIGVSIYVMLSILVLCANKVGFLIRLVIVEYCYGLGKMFFGFMVFWSYIVFF